jgi:putative ABC transport system permease protein
MHHLRFTFRIFLKDKFFSALNVLGLALGIAVSMILVLILKTDLSYDKHYTNHERIYRLGSHYVIPDIEAYIGATARELAPIIRQTYPEIEELVRIDQLHHILVSNNSKVFFEESISQTDPTYFKVFDHKFIAGDVSTCLKDPKSVVITKSVATKYFDKEEALGKTLIINKESRTVTAVIEDLPEATHLKFSILISGLPDARTEWQGYVASSKPIPLMLWNPDVSTYLLLPEDYDVNNFYNRFSGIYKDYFIGDDVGGKGTANDPFLEPLATIHFSKSESEGEFKALLAFATIGVLIVILACINYMNLSTAKAVKRATEITMKRLAGSGKSRLVRGLLVEAMALSVLSFLLATAMVYILLTPLNSVTGRDLSPDLFSITISFFVALVIGILSGLYPALYLTNIPVIATLKGRFRNSKSALILRRSLITLQFSISIFVVVCTLFMSSQLQFIRTRSLGFDKDNLLIVPMHPNVKKQRSAIQNEIRQIPNVVATATAGQVLGTGVGIEQMLIEGPKGIEQHPFLALYVDDGFLEMMGVELIEGRMFGKGEEVETNGIYLATEFAAKFMNWGDDALGKQVAFFGDQNHGKVIGVVKDFNVNALYSGVDPMMIIKGHFNSGYLHVKLTGDKIPETIEAVRRTITRFDNEHPFEYFFLDQKYDEQYKADVNRNRLLSILSYVCVFISVLGLLGLTAFSAVQRTKEIGIRKVLGANLGGILLLLSKDIVLLVILASAIAMPVSWYVIDGWLEGFAYRAPFSYLVLTATIFSAMLFVIAVTVFQSWRTVNANPVDSLKYE